MSFTEDLLPDLSRINKTRRRTVVRFGLSAVLLAVILGLFPVLLSIVHGERASYEIPKIGEKLTYTISFNNYDSAAFAEIQAVSRGKMDGRDAIELRGKLVSVDVLRAAFYLWDNSRTTFIDPGTGYPVFIRETDRSGPLPKSTVLDYLKQPAPGLDLLALVYKVREAGGVGSFSLSEGGSVYSFDLTAAGTETVETEAGEFDTTVSTVESEFFSGKNITRFRVNFSNDERHLPVLLRFKTPKGDFVARLAGIQDLSSTPPPTATPTPTPVVIVTPKPTASPRPYVDNQPLSGDLPFRLGETLEYAVTRSGSLIGKITLSAAERKMFRQADSLHLVAEAVEAGGSNGLFGAGDTFGSWVDPVTLVPLSTELKLTGVLAKYSQQASFDQSAGTVTVPGAAPVQVPVGTHNLLSLAYAVRAFDLRPLIDPTNPGNDTRVAVFAGNESHVITLRPSKTEEIEVQGRKQKAQLISVRTGDPATDRLNIKIWLGTDGRRIPLRFSAGNYAADLVAITNKFTDK